MKYSNRYVRVTISVLLVVLMSAPCALGQDTTSVTYDSGIDAWLHTNGKNYGGHTETGVYSYDLGGVFQFVHRTEIKFNSVDTIPLNATIVSADLIMTVQGQGSASNGYSGGDAEVNRIVRDWTEGTGVGTVAPSNWVEATASVDWTHLGGDRDSTTSYGDRYIPLGLLMNDTLMFNVTGLVQEWADGADSFGMMIKMVDDLNPATNEKKMVYWYSFEAAAANHPRLEVKYLVPASPPSTPTGVTATDGDNHDKIAVSWNVVADADSYQVFSTSDSLGSYSYLASTSSNTDTTYDDTAADKPTLNDPANLTATDDTLGNHIALSWSAASMTDGDTLYYKVVAFNEDLASDTSLVNGGYTRDTIDSYDVERSADDSDGGYGSLVTGVTAVSFNDSTAPPDTINAPTSLTATDSTYLDKIDVSWSGQSVLAGAGRYYRLRAISAGNDTSSYTVVNRGFIGDTIASIQIDTSSAVGGPFDTLTVIADTTAFTHGSLSTGTTIYYKTRAITLSGETSSFTAAEVGNTQYPASITGVVTDSLTGLALNGVQVDLSPSSAQDSTDGSGTFAFHNLDPSLTYSLSFVQTHYTQFDTASVDVAPNDTTTLNTIQLVPNDTSSVFVNINFTEGSVTKNMQFGFHPTATIGFDPTLNEVELPPLLSGSVFDTRFALNDSLGNGSLIDIQNSDYDTLTQYISLQRDNSAVNVSVSWDAIPDIGQKFTLIEMTGPFFGTSVNMRSQTNHTITDSNVDGIKIIIGPSQFATWVMDYSAGWNLVSLAGTSVNNNVVAYFPPADSTAYSYDATAQSFSTSTTLSEGIGYWVDLSSALNTVSTVESVDSLDLSVKMRWNMIGSISDTISLGDIVQDPSNSIISIYKYENSQYVLETVSLLPGLGYWAKLNADASLTLSNGSAGKQSGYNPHNSFITNAQHIPINISTSYGTEKIELLIGNDGDQSINEQFELPPPGAVSAVLRTVCLREHKRI